MNNNKRLLTTLSSLIMLLSGCTTLDNVDNTLLQDNYKTNKILVSEICLPTFNFQDDFITGHTTKKFENSELIGIFSTNYRANLQGLTSNYHYIFRSNVGNPNELKTYTVLNNEETGNEFVYERDFSKYKVNEWSNWEKPDYMVKASQLMLKTKSKDNIELLKLPFTLKQMPKVRFNIMEFEQYLKLVRSKKTIYLQRNLDICE